MILSTFNHISGRLNFLHVFLTGASNLFILGTWFFAYKHLQTRFPILENKIQKKWWLHSFTLDKLKHVSFLSNKSFFLYSLFITIEWARCLGSQTTFKGRTPTYSCFQRLLTGITLKISRSFNRDKILVLPADLLAHVLEFTNAAFIVWIWAFCLYYLNTSLLLKNQCRPGWCESVGLALSHVLKCGLFDSQSEHMLMIDTQ